MTRIRDLYRCNICKNVIEVVHEGAPALVCCDEPMEKLEAKTEDEGREKHVPVAEGSGSGTSVKVGSVEHPMEEAHYIKFIEILTPNKVGRVELKPGEKPEAEFLTARSDIIEVREYCTVHGLWKA